MKDTSVFALKIYTAMITHEGKQAERDLRRFEEWGAFKIITKACK